MKNGAILLAAGAAALFLSKKTKKKSSSSNVKAKDEGSKDNEGMPLPSLDDPKDVSEIQGALPPGQYIARDGDSVLLEVGMESTGPIGGMVTERDGEVFDDIYVPLKSGFEIEYHLEGVRLTFIRPGSYKIAALSIESDPPIWSFEVEE